MLAVILLMTLAWGALYGWIVPRIGQYRAALQTQATKVLGVPVRLGAISARSNGLIPTFELSDVQLLDSQGRAALRLPQVTLTLSPRSLLSRGFEQMHLQGVDVDIRRTPDGRIWVAGFDIGRTDGGSGGADWLFSQPEVVVRSGRVRWVDELRGAPELALEQVDFTLRSGRWRHSARLDATPPATFGQRFTAVARMREPVLSLGRGGWQSWSGQLYAAFDKVDVSKLGRYADLGQVAVKQGSGAVRAWLDVDRGALVGGTADLALSQVDVQLGADLQALRLRDVKGRLGGRRDSAGFRAFTKGLQFTRESDEEGGQSKDWPGGNLRLSYRYATAQAPAYGQFEAEQLDLAAMERIAVRLPLSESAHAALRRYAPKGLVERVAAHWQGPLDAPVLYDAKGLVRGVAVPSSAPASASSPALASTPAGHSAPGIRGAQVDFDLNQQGGKATVKVVDGALELPGVFEDPVVPLDALSAQVNWKIEGEHVSVAMPQAEFSNADAAGTAQATWHTSDPATSPAKSRFPGVLDLQGMLKRADGTRVHRYLPLVVPESARHYVRDAIQAGRASRVDFVVRGDLHDMPFLDPKSGDFRIAAQLQGVNFAYVPPQIQSAGEARWPALDKLSGELVFERAGMQVKNARGSFEGFAGLQASGVEARISDLGHSVVEVSANASGPLPQMLAFAAASPVAALTGRALAQASGTGNAELTLGLQLPIAQLKNAVVKGRLALSNNDVRITPDTPLLARTRGAVQFTQTGFSVEGAQANALGGDVRIDGGMRSKPGELSVVEMRAQGTATAQGLQQASELGLLAQIARKASGSAAYELNLKVRHRVPEVLLTTNLQGMALDLPAPLAKAAGASLPVRFQNQLTASSLPTANASNAPVQERLSIDVGDLAALRYDVEKQEGGDKVLRGSIAVGVPKEDQPSLPVSGVEANLRFDALDLDAWQAVVDGAPASSGAAAKRPASPPSSPAPAAGSMQNYLPQVFALQAGNLQAQGRSLHKLVVGGSRMGNVWRANLDAQELNGYVEYRQGAEGSEQSSGVYARLSRLQVPDSVATQVDALLDEQPMTLPGLDIVVDAFELRGRRLGRLEIDARNRSAGGGAREWRLAKFNLTMPEAAFTASGNWARLSAAAVASGKADAPGPDAAAKAPAPERRTVLNFVLDMQDAGALLARLGMADVVRKGKGRIDGQVGWLGAPISPDYHTMTGQVHMDVGAGQFLKADPGLAKLLSVLSLQSLPRRFALDFRDVFSEGFAFDFVRGDVGIERGVASTNNLQMKGVNAAVLMEGSADIGLETQDLHVVVVPEVNALTASLVATAINPVIGLGSFLAQVFLRGPLIAAATQEFSVKGTWSDPDVSKLPRRRLSEALRAARHPLSNPKKEDTP